MMSLPTIQQVLQKVRYRLARVTLWHDSLLALLLISSSLTTAIWYEKQLYLAASVRTVIAWALADIILLIVLILTIRGLGIWLGWWPWISHRALAKRIGYRVSPESDRLLNGLELEYRLESGDQDENRDLLEHAVIEERRKLAAMDFRTLTPRRFRPPPRLVLFAVGMMVVAWATAPRAMLSAGERLLHPEIDYPAPTPFTLLALSGSQEILGGDTAIVVFTGFSAIPPDIELVWRDRQGNSGVTLLNLANERYRFDFTDLRDDLFCYARYRNPSWFSSWDEVVTDTIRFHIVDRPVLENITFTIEPPPYTGEPVENMKGNVAEIAALEGSRIIMEGEANLPLEAAWLKSGANELPMTVDSNTVWGEFQLEESLDLTILIRDKRDVQNADPIHYTLTALKDFAPTLSLVLPLVDVDLDESMLLPIHFDTADDYGISRAQVTYEIIHPQYLSRDDRIYTHPIPEVQPDRKSQRVAHVWELADLGLVPGDRVEFHIEVYDNNNVSGPGKAVSQTLIARLPTLAELFTQAAQQSDDALEASSATLEDIRKIQDILQEMEKSLREENEVTWEQQQRSQEAVKSLDALLQNMEQIQEQIAQVQSLSEDNQLFGEELLRKYDELQNLLDQILTPELRQAMEKLQQAMKNLDPELFRQAMQNMQLHTDELESQLDRFLDIFQQAVAEMKMDELVTRLDRLAAAETHLLEQLGREDPLASQPEHEATWSEQGQEAATPWGLQDLAARHEEQERAFAQVRETMREAADAIRPYSQNASDQLVTLRGDDRVRAAESSLKEGTRAMKAGNQQGSQTAASKSQNLLQDLHAEAERIQETFQSETVKDMQSKFQRVLLSVLSLSRRQEALATELDYMPRNSPRITQAAEDQHTLIKGLNQITAQMMELSRQSFHITPTMGRSIGQVTLSMRQAVEHLTEANPREAAKAERASMQALNETALELSRAMAGMEASGSASGFDQYLKRMEQLSQAQQGLNQQTLSFQLGQMGALSQMEMMSRLKARQRQLAEALRDILQDFPDESGGERGGLGAARQEMEDVIRDFERRRVTRRTIERQQNILSRMLDSQKSLATQDYKEERAGTVATESFTYTGPLALPTGLGQREDQLMEAMEQALRAGYSPEYQRMIQLYFQRLISQTLEQAKTTEDAIP